jgi:hypothetical protein
MDTHNVWISFSTAGHLKDSMFLGSLLRRGRAKCPATAAMSRSNIA